MRRHQKFIQGLVTALESFRNDPADIPYSKGYLLALLWVAKEHKLPIGDDEELNSQTKTTSDLTKGG